MQPIFTFLAFLAGFSFSFSQTQIAGRINDYAQVNTIDYCQGRIRVGDASVFKSGDKVLLVQMKGATINETNTSGFGGILNLGAAGLYEMNTIKSINGNEIFLKFSLVNQYNIAGLLQLVSVPQYRSATVIDTLRPLPWNGRTGGILALEVSDTLNLRAPIDISGMGFRGGMLNVLVSDCSFLTLADDYHYPISNWRGAPKGEGIAAQLSGKEQGRGPQANGGGGGNDHNSGGGGGANVSAGGSGGFENAAGLGCDGNFPGLGGKALSNLQNRIFMGGGGGAGHVNNAGAGSAGGNGGGIAFILAKELRSNGYAILAKGQTPVQASGDGGGGGGGGGVVYLDVKSTGENPVIEAKGGNGGRVINSADRCYGAGGGGSGGKVISNMALTALISITGGQAGVNTVSSALCSSPSNGAQAGENGVKTNLFPIPASAVEILAPSVLAMPSSLTGCEGNTFQFDFKVQGTSLVYQWQLNNGTAWVNVTNNAQYSGGNSPILEVKNALPEMNGFLFRCKVTSTCFGELISDSATLSVNKKPVADFSTGSSSSLEVQFLSKSSGGSSYVWAFGDGSSSTQENPLHKFASGGSFDVLLTVSNTCGSASKSQKVVIAEPLKADFKADFTSGCVPFTVKFRNQSKGTGLTTFKWEFVGGTPSKSTEENPEVKYLQAGIFDVKLTVGNSVDSNTIVLRRIIVVAKAPKAAFLFESSALNVQFQNRSIESSYYHWDFGDGTSSFEENPKHSYGKAGIFNVTLTAYNESCGSAIAQQVFVSTTGIANKLPVFQVSVFPNPFSELISVKSDYFPEGSWVSLYGLDGKKLLEAPIRESETVLQVSHLSTGIYILEVRSPQGRSLTFKLIKLR